MSGDYREAAHLPKRRRDGRPAPPEGLPRQRRGTTPQMRARYPDYDVLEQVDHWDDATREVVLARLEPRELRFFDVDEAASLRAFCDVVLAQDEEPRVPVLEHVDANLADGKLEGYQYADMPDDRDTWRLVARGLDEAARERGAASMAAAPPAIRDEVCRAFSAGELSGGAWERLNVTRAWSVAMRDTLSAFYAHPWAWNEIGFGGPAYPRGYARLGAGMSESWEGREAFDVDPVEDVRRRGVDE
jgi:Gluconate 2-dehydrogenase subunit 3